MSNDAEKAFDRVDRGFIMSTLQHLGLGPKITRWIKNLYNRPTAMVKVNRKLSSAFEMYNGTRQGCSLSPLLYVRSIEPFLATLQNNRDIRGVRVGQEEHKIAAYADDILMYVTNPRVKLPNIIREIK